LQNNCNFTGIVGEIVTQKDKKHHINPKLPETLTRINTSSIYYQLTYTSIFLTYVCHIIFNALVFK